jgi:hypothetical protein
MLPDFNSDGDLPAGVHPAEWNELVQRFGWTDHRRALLDGLKMGLDSLRTAGCLTAYLDGSFITSKEHPGDFDACWELTGVDPTKLDPILLIFDNRRAAQKAKYLGEFFPSAWSASTSGPLFLDFFQLNKVTGNKKGIVAIDLRRLP